MNRKADNVENKLIQNKTWQRGENESRDKAGRTEDNESRSKPDNTENTESESPRESGSGKSTPRERTPRTEKELERQLWGGHRRGTRNARTTNLWRHRNGRNWLTEKRLFCYFLKIRLCSNDLGRTSMICLKFFFTQKLLNACIRLLHRCSNKYSS